MQLLLLLIRIYFTNIVFFRKKKKKKKSHKTNDASSCWWNESMKTWLYDTFFLTSSSSDLLEWISITFCTYWLKDNDSPCFWQWTNQPTDRLTDWQTGWQMHQLMDGRTNGQTQLERCKVASKKNKTKRNRRRKQKNLAPNSHWDIFDICCHPPPPPPPPPHYHHHPHYDPPSSSPFPPQLPHKWFNFSFAVAITMCLLLSFHARLCL